MYVAIILVSVMVPLLLVPSLILKDRRRRERVGVYPNAERATPALYRQRKDRD